MVGYSESETRSGAGGDYGANTCPPGEQSSTIQELNILGITAGTILVKIVETISTLITGIDIVSTLRAHPVRRMLIVGSGALSIGLGRDIARVCARPSRVAT